MGDGQEPEIELFVKVRRKIKYYSVQKESFIAVQYDEASVMYFWC